MTLGVENQGIGGPIMLSRHCHFPKELQAGLAQLERAQLERAQLERGGPPRRLGDVLGDVLTQWDVVLPGPGAAVIDVSPADWPWAESAIPEELEFPGDRESCIESVWAVA
jgi:hypothetical protein